MHLVSFLDKISGYKLGLSDITRGTETLKQQTADTERQIDTFRDSIHAQQF
jgi:hypothetical protein